MKEKEEFIPNKRYKYVGRYTAHDFSQANNSSSNMKGFCSCGTMSSMIYIFEPNGFILKNIEYSSRRGYVCLNIEKIGAFNYDIEILNDIRMVKDKIEKITMEI
jgi:hypothetical protein